MPTDPMHDRLLEITLALPGAVEDWPWGSVHCKVGGKIFVGWSRTEDGRMRMGFRTDKVLQSMLVASDPRFSVAKYVGQYGGVDMLIGKKPNWDEIENFIVESYRIIAPKKLIRELDAREGRLFEAPVEKPAKRETVTKKAAKPAAGAKTSKALRDATKAQKAKPKASNAAKRASAKSR